MGGSIPAKAGHRKRDPACRAVRSLRGRENARLQSRRADGFPAAWQSVCFEAPTLFSAADPATFKHFGDGPTGPSAVRQSEIHEFFTPPLEKLAVGAVSRVTAQSK